MKAALPGPHTPARTSESWSAAADLTSKVHPWHVLHACVKARDVLPVLDAQSEAGMRPVLVSASGDPLSDGAETEASLLSAWQHVRHWRKTLLENDPAFAADVVHAHTFSAGMAAVRTCPAVVYDIPGFIEAIANESGQCAENSWLARSFRVAEQFVLAHAGALVTHTLGMQQELAERGYGEHVFMLPSPISAEAFERSPMNNWLRRMEIADEVTTTLFVANGAPMPETEGAPQQPASDFIITVLDAFERLHRQHPDTKLIWAFEPEHAELLLTRASDLGIAGAVYAVPARDAETAMRSADIVIVGGGESRVPLAPNQAMLSAMSAGCAVVAADDPANREAAPEGQGCLWVTASDADDIATRCATLVRHHEFRRALGDSARRFLQLTRSPQVVARGYDEAYRRAQSRRRNINPSASSFELLPHTV